MKQKHLIEHLNRCDENELRRFAEEVGLDTKTVENDERNALSVLILDAFEKDTDWFKETVFSWLGRLDKEGDENSAQRERAQSNESKIKFLESKIGSKTESLETKIEEINTNAILKLNAATVGIRSFSIILGAVFSVSAFFGVGSFLDIQQKARELNAEKEKLENFIDGREEENNNLVAEWRKKLADADAMHRRHTLQVREARKQSNTLLTAFRDSKDRQFDDALRELISSLRFERKRETLRIISEMQPIRNDLQIFSDLAKKEKMETPGNRSIKYPAKIRLQQDLIDTIEIYAKWIIKSKEEQKESYNPTSSFITDFDPSAHFITAREKSVLRNLVLDLERGESSNKNEIQWEVPNGSFSVSDEHDIHDNKLKPLIYIAQISRHLMEGNMMRSLYDDSADDAGSRIEAIRKKASLVLDLSKYADFAASQVGSEAAFFQDTILALKIRGYVLRSRAHQLLADTMDARKDKRMIFENAVEDLNLAEGLLDPQRNVMPQYEDWQASISNNRAYMLVQLSEFVEPGEIEEILERATQDMDRALKLAGTRSRPEDALGLYRLTNVEVLSTAYSYYYDQENAEKMKETLEQLKRLLLNQIDPDASSASDHLTGKHLSKIELLSFEWLLKNIDENFRSELIQRFKIEAPENM